MPFCGGGAPEARRQECKQMWRGVARWRLKGALPETQRWIGAREKKANDDPKCTQRMHQGMQRKNKSNAGPATIAVIAFIRRPRREQVGGMGGGEGVLDVPGILMGSDSLAPRLLPLSNHLLSWHLSELRNDATPPRSLTSGPYSKRRAS